MEKVLIFAGTTEGRMLAERAGQLHIWCMVSAATEYGASLLEEIEGVETRYGRLDAGEMKELISREGITLVIDATHPFAVEVTRQIRQACDQTDTRYVRCLREAACDEPFHLTDQKEMVLVPGVREAAEYLKGTRGKILIATGSKELSCYTEIEDYKERCFVRVLSTREAVEESVSLGFEGRHLIAMQGPFSEEMNLALLHQTGADYFVTKESGRAGGYDEKVSAAQKAGAVLVVVGRPREEGESLEDVMRLLAELDVI